MEVFYANDRVIHDNGKYGTVIDSWASSFCASYVTVKFDDGTIKTVHRCYLAKLPDHWQKLTKRS